MKDNSTTPTVHRVGSFTESKFGIASSEDLVYIFDILRNKLYSDKALAVVREYTTNAADANTEAGFPDDPIIITVPNQMAPSFKVRDFGRGLSEEDVRSVYCMYGRSTKRQSNAFTGQLGLGSKSGFAYGDSFTITSFHNGIKTVYTAYIDESKLGAIAKIQESKTNERPGVEITIPVKANDVSIFQRKIEEVCKFFRVKPTINGNINISPIIKHFSGRDWVIQHSENKYGPKQAIAVMGNIGYPIDASQVYPGEYNDYWRTKTGGLKMLMANSILYFNIGDLSIAASREELEYNASTIETIKKVSAKAWSEFFSSLQKELDKCKDGLEARAFMHKLNQSSSGNWGDITSNLKWNGKAAPSALIVTDKEVVAIDAYIFNGSSYSKTQNAAIAANDETVNNGLMFLCDEPFGQQTRMHFIAKKNQGKPCYLFKVKVKEDSQGNKTDGYDWFEENDFPIERLIKLSTIVVDKQPSQGKRGLNSIGKDNIKVYKLASKTSAWGTQSDNWTEVIVPKTDIKYHVVIDKFKVIPPSVSSRDAADFDGFIRVVKKNICDIPEYFAVKNADTHKIEETSECLFEYLKKQIITSQTFKNGVSKSMDRRAIGNAICAKHSSITYLPKLIKMYDDGEFSSDKLFYKAMGFVKAYKEREDNKYLDLRDALNKFYFLQEFESKSESSATDVFDELEKTYPLIQFLGHVYHDNYDKISDAIAEYVNAIDGK